MVDKDAKVIPIIDCPNCGKKDVPLSHEATMVKGTKKIEIWSCSSCGIVPNIAVDVKIKNYISPRELEELGWEEELILVKGDL